MSSRRPRGAQAIRSTLDRVLVHEIKNIAFRLQLLRANLEQHGHDPEFRPAASELLRTTIERLDRLAGRWSEHEDAVLIKVALDLNALLREVASGSLRRDGRELRASSRTASLALALSDLPSVWGDPFYLRDALASLIENALEAAGPGGKVLVRSFSSGSSPRLRANIEVIDNGPGMSPEFVRDRLFLPFQTTKPDGVGLGFFTANQIVRHHGGQIRVRSGPGEGTVIRLSFPAALP